MLAPSAKCCEVFDESHEGDLHPTNNRSQNGSSCNMDDSFDFFFLVWWDRGRGLDAGDVGSINQIQASSMEGIRVLSRVRHFSREGGVYREDSPDRSTL